LIFIVLYYFGTVQAVRNNAMKNKKYLTTGTVPK
jgi:hypothetical protein